MTLAEFITSAHITMTAERTDANPAMENSRDMDHWKVVLRAGRSRMTTYFSMGYGHNGNEPATKDVLDCLASDASSADQDFEQWCGDYGYDVDSRKAERTYKAVQKATEKLKRLLGDSAFDTLVYHTERE